MPFFGVSKAMLDQTHLTNCQHHLLNGLRKERGRNWLSSMHACMHDVTQSAATTMSQRIVVWEDWCARKLFQELQIPR